jgi:hypothetical protein
MLTFLISVLFTFYIQEVLKFKYKTPVPKGEYLVSTIMKLLSYIVFSTSLLPRSAQARISSPAPYARKRSAYVSPSVCTHTRQQTGKITNYKSKINWDIKVLWDNKGYTRTDRLNKVISPRLHWQRVILLNMLAIITKYIVTIKLEEWEDGGLESSGS